MSISIETIEGKKPKRFRAEFLEQGVCSYTDVGHGVILLRNEAISKMLRSFIGKPVINVNHEDLTPTEAFDMNSKKEDRKIPADGIVAEVGFDSITGWYWADLLIWDQDTIKNIDEEGFSISCAYIPTSEDSTGGRYHAIDYDEEVLDGFFTHMAIVDSPRYEGAKIYPNSLKGKGGDKLKGDKKKGIFNFLVKKKDPVEEVKELKNQVLVDDEGNEFNAADLIKHFANNMEEDEKKENAEDGDKLKMTDKVNINGREYTMKQIYDKVAANMKKDNAEGGEDDNAEGGEDDKEKEEKKEEPKKEAKNNNFYVLKNAAQHNEPILPNIDTEQKKIKRGQARYGKIVKNAGGKE